MNKSTTSLSFPDVNVWLALVLEHHVHRPAARDWWRQNQGPIAFTRFTELALLRLLTTSAAMDGQPLRMDEAWRVHDGLFADERVALYPEPAAVEERFRQYASGQAPSPKRWADAWLLAVAHSAGGILVTFDRALAARGAWCLLPDPRGEA
jgi:toxin-antitoxin system PIN domain toxin